MKSFRFIAFLLIIISVSALAACGAPAQSQEQPTAVEQTVTNQLTTPSGKIVSGNGVEFTIPTGLGTDATSSIVPEFQPDPNGPGQDIPAYLQFKLQGYPVNTPDEYTEAQVQVFSTSGNVHGLNGDVNKINAIIAAPNMQLTKDSMPSSYLVMASNIKVIASADGSVRGARMLSLHGNGLPLATNDGTLAYQFHGVTSDGKYYVIVQLPITAPFLQENMNAPVPAGGVPTPDMNGIDAYYQQVVALLNSAETTGTLLPSIAAMDTLVQSLTINGSALVLPAPLPTPSQ